jgi:hypothetical protein
MHGYWHKFHRKRFLTLASVANLLKPFDVSYDTFGVTSVKNLRKYADSGINYINMSLTLTPGANLIKLF